MTETNQDRADRLKRLHHYFDAMPETIRTDFHEAFHEAHEAVIWHVKMVAALELAICGYVEYDDEDAKPLKWLADRTTREANEALALLDALAPLGHSPAARALDERWRAAQGRRE